MVVWLETMPIYIGMTGFVEDIMADEAREIRQCRPLARLFQDRGEKVGAGPAVPYLAVVGDRVAAVGLIKEEDVRPLQADVKFDFIGKRLTSQLRRGA
jgi:hypothetical protein